MKKSKLFLGVCIGAAMLLTVGCNPTANHKKGAAGSIETEKEDALTFTTLKDSITEKDSAYTSSISIEFPVGGSMGIRQSIQHYLSTKLTHFIPNTDLSDTASVNAAAFKQNSVDGKALLQYYHKKYISGFVSWMDSVERPRMIMFQEVKGTKLWQSDKVITYGIDCENFMGGAHGTHMFYAASFNIQNGKPIQIVDTTKIDGMQKMMYEGLRKDYFNQKDMPHTDKDIAGILWDKRIPLPNEHLVMHQDGVYFFYQQYEITAFVFGSPNFTIPYEKIKPFMTPEAIALIPN